MTDAQEVHVSAIINAVYFSLEKHRAPLAGREGPVAMPLFFPVLAESAAVPGQISASCISSILRVCCGHLSSTASSAFAPEGGSGLLHGCLIFTASTIS